MTGKSMKSGRIVELRDGSGVVQDDDGNLIPAVDEVRGVRKPGERVQFVVESVASKADPSKATELARIWSPE